MGAGLPCSAHVLDVCVYRYVRAEVIAGFVNALFLLFIAFFIFAEAIEVSIKRLVHNMALELT